MPVRVLQKIAVSTIFRTLLRNLQLYAYTSASTGLRILQNLQNLPFLANFTIFRQLIAKFAIFSLLCNANSTYQWRRSHFSDFLQLIYITETDRQR